MKASIPKEDLDYIMRESGEGIEVEPSEVYFILEKDNKGNLTQGTKEVMVYKENVESSLEEAWNVLYKSRKLLFKEIFV